MKTLRLICWLGMGAVWTALADPADRPLDAEDVPEVQMHLKVQGGDEALIRDVLREAGLDLGLIAGPELKAAKGGWKPLSDAETDLEPPEIRLERAQREIQQLLDAGVDFVGESEPRWIIGLLFGDPEEDGLVVTSVLEGTPAEEAGLESGDRILSLNRIKLRDREMLVNLIQVVRDQPVWLQVERGEVRKRVKVTARTAALSGPASAQRLVPLQRPEEGKAAEQEPAGVEAPPATPKAQDLLKPKSRQPSSPAEEIRKLRRELQDLRKRVEELEK